MNILIVCNHFAVCSGRYMAAAFRRQGHNVRHIGPAKGREIWGTVVPPQYVWEPNAPSEHFEPNLIICMDSDPAILDSFEGKGVPVVVYGVDNHVRNYRRDYFTHYFLAHYHGQVQPVTQDDESWLPCGYDPVFFTPSRIPFDGRAYDVVMLGVMYPERAAAMDELAKAGFKVVAGTGIVYEAYANLHHNARIALCLNANDDLSQRWFEAAAMGCHVLGSQPADIRDDKTAGVLGLAGFSTIDAFADKANDVPITFWVDNLLKAARQECKEATLEMQRRVMRHAWDARARTIADWVMLRDLPEDAKRDAMIHSGDPFLQHALGFGLPDIEAPGIKLPDDAEVE